MIIENGVCMLCGTKFIPDENGRCSYCEAEKKAAKELSSQILTAENYFSPENNLKYMGSSQYKSFLDCEARALAEVRGVWKRPPTTALLVGSYVDAHFSDEMNLFRAQHPEIFKRDGNLKAEYEDANYIISRIESDDLFMMLMAGEKQVIRTGEIAGVPFKIKIDCLLDAAQCSAIVKAFPETADWFGLCDGANVDMKIMRNFEQIWSDEARSKIPFVEAWGYDIQGAIYQHVEGNMLPFFIAGATKETEPDLSIMGIPYDALSAKLVEIEDNAPRFQAIKQGQVEPTRCEKCDYCKATRKLTRIIDYREV